MRSVKNAAIVIVAALAIHAMILGHAIADETTTDTAIDETSVTSTTFDSYSTESMSTTTLEIDTEPAISTTTEQDEATTNEPTTTTTEFDTTSTATEESIASTTDAPTTTDIPVDTTTDAVLEESELVQEKPIKCKDGLLLPAWKPDANLTTGDRFSRGLVYFLVMCYLFLGVSIVSDRFMAAIEKITAIEKEVTIRKPDGTQQTVVVRVWNETVANLTLMALGTSAPEILLSIIEIFSMNFQAGDLGPGTIVGSAAFNLFAIIAICILAVPNGEVRRIKHLRVFFVTATFSVFAYIWLYFILAVSSPGVVSVFEGFITFMFFPLIVWMAYTADRRTLVFKYLDKGYRMSPGGVMVATETDAGLQMKGRSESLQSDELPADYKDFEQIKEEYITILRELRAKYPQHNRDTLEMMAQQQLLDAGPKSRAFYRMQATRKMLGGGNILRKIAERTQTEVKADLSTVSVQDDDDDLVTPRILFDPQQYTVMENCGSVRVRVVRRGNFADHVSVSYHTEDGSAEAVEDYIPKSGTITFTPGIAEGFIEIEIIDDDVFEQDEQFYVRLSNPTNGAILGTPDIATIMILDDDHGGFFQFEEESHELIETIGVYELKVVRLSGARGRVILPYWTENFTAIAGKSYETKRGQLIFDNNVTE